MPVNFPAPSAPSHASTVVGATNELSHASSTPTSAARFDGNGNATPIRNANNGAMSGVVGVRNLPTYSLPATVELGVNTIHRYTDPRVTPSVIAVTVFTPMPTGEVAGPILDMNKKTHSEVLPHRCILGDAGVTRAFIGIDKRPGTPLDLALEKILLRVPDRNDHESVIEFVRAQVNQIIAWAPGAARNDGSPYFEWDMAIHVAQSVWDTFASVAHQNVGDAPVGTGVQFPVVPFEKWLSVAQGYCIQKALLGALLLEKAGVPCRLVQGAVAQGPGRTVGHSWIELQDGRILDAAWSSLQQPTERDPQFPERFRFGGSFRFENQRFPYLRD